MSVEGQAAVMSEWQEFLGGLDANVTWTNRAETLTDVCKAFAKSGLCNKSELMGMTVADLEENPKGAKRAIMLKAFDAVNLKEISNSLPSAGQETALASTIRQAVDGVSRQALSNLATAMRLEDKSVRVPMESMLKQTTLAGLGKSCLPQGALVDELATQASKLVKRGVTKPFVAVDLRKYVPHWCAVGSMDSMEDAEEPSSMGKEVGKVMAKQLGYQEKPQKGLTIMQWQLACDRFAIAAAACDQLKYTSAMAHKVVCMKVAARADAKGRSQWLAVIYDRLARKHWAEMAYYNTDGFDVNVASLQVDNGLLDDAMEEFDETSKRNEHQRGAWNTYPRGGSYGWSGAGSNRNNDDCEPDFKRQRM